MQSEVQTKIEPTNKEPAFVVKSVSWHPTVLSEAEKAAKKIAETTGHRRVNFSEFVNTAVSEKLARHQLEQNNPLIRQLLQSELACLLAQKPQPLASGRY